MTATSPTTLDFSVAPASVWRLLWLWVPMLGIALLIVVSTVQSAQRTPHELGLTVPFLLLVTAVLSWAFFRRRIRLDGRTLDVQSTFYRKRVAVQDMQLERARVVDLKALAATPPAD